MYKKRSYQSRSGRNSKYGKFAKKKSFGKRSYVPRNKMNAITKYSTHKAINPKVKTLDLDFGAYAQPFVVDQLANGGIPINSTATLQNLVTIQQGASESQRVGNKVALKSLRVRLQAKPSGGDSLIDTHGRFMIIYDRQTNGAYPAANAILSSLNQSGTTIAGTYLDSINPNYLERYVVLADEILTFQPTASAGQNEDVGPTSDKAYYIDRYIKMKNLETQFNGSTTPLGIGSVTTGAVYVLSWGDATTPGTNDPYFWSGNIRLRFHDC